MNITIAGSGFGLYGYLPALIASGRQVLLPCSYQPIVLARRDICHYFEQIDWTPDADSALDRCEGVVIAVPPARQPEIVRACLVRKNIQSLLLEKPLAKTPQEAMNLLTLLESSGKTFRIGYHFRYTDWGAQLLKEQRGPDSIEWSFHAHHFANALQTWKREHPAGGGALRFYGIHLIALLAELGYREASRSILQGSPPETATNWMATLTGNGLPDCRVSVTTKSHDTRFKVSMADKIYSSLQPFPTVRGEFTVADSRIPFLIAGLNDLLEGQGPSLPWYRETNLLWQKLEALT